jgi:hypothetical protein
MKIHFISMMLTSNVADYQFNPLPYFPEFLDIAPCIRHNYDRLEWQLIEPEDWVILSGDILNFDEIHKKHRDIIMLSNLVGGRLILWGGGISNPSNADKNLIDNIGSKFALLSTREFKFNNFRCVPCVSCMMPQLDNVNREARYSVGVIEHKNYPISEFDDYPKISNAFALSQVLDFIGICEAIITNSYHMAYWGTLLNKKVVIYTQYADKYRYLKYKQPFYSGVIEKDVLRSSLYVQALEEARGINKKFCDDVIDLIKADNGSPNGMRKILLNVFQKLNGKRIVIRGNGLHTEWLLRMKLFDPIFIWDKTNEGDIENYDVDVVVISSFEHRLEMRGDVIKRGYNYFDLYDALSKLKHDVKCNFWEADIKWE